MKVLAIIIIIITTISYSYSNEIDSNILPKIIDEINEYLPIELFEGFIFNKIKMINNSIIYEIKSKNEYIENINRNNLLLRKGFCELYKDFNINIELLITDENDSLYKIKINCENKI